MQNSSLGHINKYFGGISHHAKDYHSLNIEMLVESCDSYILHAHSPHKRKIAQGEITYSETNLPVSINFILTLLRSIQATMNAASNDTTQTACHNAI
jgi:hypothetical protein